MFQHRWFKVWLVAVCLSGAPYTIAGAEDFDVRILTQANAEAILHAQTVLRRHLITTLANISHVLIQLEEFRSLVDDIVTGLQIRALDPLISLMNVHNNQSGSSQMASIIYNLQGGAQQKKTIPEWTFLLDNISYIPPLPDIHLDIQSLHRFGHPFVDVVLKGLKKNLKANNHLVRDVLYNYRFPSPTPDVYVIVGIINRKFRVDFRDFEPHSNSVHPSEILSDILLYMQHRTGSGYELDHLRSSLSNVDRVKTTEQLFEIFDIMHSDDYPPDVIQAKNNIMAAIKRHQIPINQTMVFHMLRGYTSSEMLLGLIAKLALIPGPYSHKARAIYPHVKLRYLSHQEKFFRPRTSSDVEFLLHSFLTVQNSINPTLIDEIPKLFVHSNIWSAFDDFDFSRYSKPRPLVLNMLQRLLDSNKLPNCYVVMIRLFLESNNWDKLFRPVNSETAAPCETYTLIVDPHALISTISPGPNWKYLSGLITAGPIFYEEYKNLTRRQVIQAIIQREMTNNLTFETSPKGEWPPVLMPSCLTSHCPKERTTEIINPSDIITIITQPPLAIVEMIMKKPIFYYEYANYSTQGEIFKALVEDRGGKLNPEIIQSVVLNTRANLPPSFIKICLKKPLNCKPIIDVQSLLETIDNNPPIDKLFPRGPFPALKYKFLGNRANILRYILRQHYSSSTGSVLNPKLMKTSNELIFNKKGNLPPVVKTICVAQEAPPSQENQIFVYDIESALEALNSSEGVSFIQNHTKNFFIPSDHKKSYSKAEVLELILAALATGPDSKVNHIKSHIMYSGPGQKPAEVKLTDAPRNILADEEVSESNCTTDEMILSVVDTDQIFTVLGPNAPEAAYLKSRIKSLIIPIGNPKKYSKGEILKEVFDQLSREISHVKMKRMIDLLKKDIWTTGVNLPEVVQVCLPNFVVEEIQAENSLLPPTNSSPEPPTDLPFLSSENIFTSTAPQSNLPFLVSSTHQTPQPVDFIDSSTPEELQPSVFSNTPTPLESEPSNPVVNSSLSPDTFTDLFTSTSQTSQPPNTSKNSTTPSSTHEYLDFQLQDTEEELFFTEDYIFAEDMFTENKTQSSFSTSTPLTTTLV